MSRNEQPAMHLRPQPKRRKSPDQRSRRTNDRLGLALLGLIQEKPVADVTVQEVLDRAAVGRSTFYLHFRDKYDLLLSQFEVFLEFTSTMLSARKEQSDRVAPVAEMFAHLASQRQLYRALEQSGYLNVFFDLAQGYFSRSIERRLRERAQLTHIPAPELSARATAFAGSLLSLLRWWMDRGAKEPASEMDRLFHSIVWNGLG